MDRNECIVDQSMSGATLEWGNSRFSTLVSRSQFHRCKIRINCPANGISLSNSVFQDCDIHAKRLRDFNFNTVGFERCRFHGQYPGCEFGFFDLFVGRKDMHGYVRQCDFSSATLDLTTFNSTELHSHVLPAWPHFAVLSADAMGAVPEFAEDPEWQVLARVFASKSGWRDEMRGVVIHYRYGGRHGFRRNGDEAMRILSDRPGFAVRV